MSKFQKILLTFSILYLTLLVGSTIVLMISEVILLPVGKYVNFSE